MTDASTSSPSESLDAGATYADRRREGLDTAAGLMAATAIFIGFLAMLNINMSIAGTPVQFRPIRVGIAAVVLALVAAGIGGRHRRLAGVALAVAALCWLLGMVFAILSGRPLY